MCIRRHQAFAMAPVVCHPAPSERLVYKSNGILCQSQRNLPGPTAPKNARSSSRCGGVPSADASSGRQNGGSTSERRPARGAGFPSEPYRQCAGPDRFRHSYVRLEASVAHSEPGDVSVVVGSDTSK